MINKELQEELKKYPDDAVVDLVNDTVDGTLELLIEDKIIFSVLYC